MTQELSEEVENPVGKHVPGRCFIFPWTVAETVPPQLYLAVEIKAEDGVSTLQSSGAMLFES